MDKISELYKQLLEDHGKQGWWPVLDKAGNSLYHPDNYSYPHDRTEQFIICIGAILTQSVAWSNVEKALKNLHAVDMLVPSRIRKVPHEQLAVLIRPAGYFNQKAKKLKIFANFFVDLEGHPTRNQLLDLWGIGKETADSMLLYAFKKPYFVIDAYTQRLFLRLGLIKHTMQYDHLRTMIETSVPKDIHVYQEFHALIVKEMKT